MAEPAVIAASLDVHATLKAMELDRDALIEVVRYADGERSLCTANDPTGFDLIIMNARAARGLREVFAGDRWERDETDNQPGIRNPFLNLRIIPCNFDQNAGNRLVDPKNLREKGTASRAKTLCNKTGWLPGFEFPTESEEDGFETYVLGTHVDEDGVVRAELSKPVNFASGKYTRFETRIILMDGSDEAGIHDTKPASSGPTDIIDIAVKRK